MKLEVESFSDLFQVVSVYLERFMLLVCFIQGDFLFLGPGTGASEKLER